MPHQQYDVVCCRVVLTDHGAFVLINVYAPNAGPAPERPRAAYKYKFLEALKAKAIGLREAGQQVSLCVVDIKHHHAVLKSVSFAPGCCVVARIKHMGNFILRLRPHWCHPCFAHMG